MTNPFTCPTCEHSITDDTFARLYAQEGVKVEVSLAYIVEQQNQIADLHRQIADLTVMGPIIDHED